MDETNPNKVCYTVYCHPNEWVGVKKVLGDEVRFVNLTNVPRNGEPPAPMTHCLVLPKRVKTLVFKARWYLDLDPATGAKAWQLTTAQWEAMLDFCRQFLAGYRHLGGKE